MKAINNYCRGFLSGFLPVLLFFSLIESVSTIVYSQNIPQEGMEVKKSNFVSFRELQRANDLSEWKKYNDPADYDHPEFGILVEDAPCSSCVEVLSRRKIDERYFVNTENPSEFYQQKALGDLNIQVNGDWVTIDHSLHPVSETIFESGYGVEHAVIDAQTRRTYIRTPSGPVYFNNWKLITRTGNNETDHGTANWSNYTVGSDGMLIHEVFPGIDAEMRVYRGAIKTNFILRSNLLGTFDELIFRDEFSAQSSTSITFSSNAMLSEGVGDLNVYSGNSELLHVGESVLFARNGPKELVQTGAYRLNGNKMDVVVPFAWIDANIGNYELVVDPVVTGTATLAQASITGSRYNASCNFTNSCDYTLAVPRPANATISNVAWTFTYTANGTSCWLQDGGIRIGVGSCVSPAVSGYYWFCNSIGGGTCTGTNQTIFSDVSSCIPAPGCTAQNVTFTLMFYRSCWGATGCSNTCIGAGSPWTMTITGNTIAYTNTATPISLSATTVCQGGSVTATTSGTNGVPGYTYNWSFNSTGSPSVGSGASASITFPSSGSVTLYSIVTDACGNSVNSSSVVTVTPGPTVTVSPSTASICPGGSTSLTASGASSFSWSPATGLSGTTGATVTASPSSTTVYTVTGTTSGCTGTTTATINVVSNPVVTVNSATICNGATATLTATGATSYTWSPSTGLSSTTGSSVTANPSSTTTYTVTGTTSGCSGTATSTVTISAPPVISVNSETICAGSSATLTASGASGYTWSPSTGLSSTTGSSVTANPSSTTTYTITETSSGCSGTTTSTVTVTPLPVVTVNSGTICAGNSTTLTANGANTYTWSPSAGLSSTTGSSVTANPSSTTTYTVTGTTTGCSNSATSTVTVTPLPSVTVNSETICAGTSVGLTANGATTYTWSPSTGLSSTTGSSVTANPSSTITYTVTGTTSGCNGTATSTVTVTPLPSVTVNSATICTGTSTTLTANGATTYTWSPSTGLSSTTGASVTANPSSTTTYTITGTTSGCSSTATSTVTVTPLPVVTVNSGTICAGASTTLTANGATSYTWSPSTGLSSATGTSVTASPTSTTTYTVTGTTTGCSGSATSTVTVTPLPAVVASNNGPLCPGEELDLSASSGSGATYSWSGPASFSSSVQNPIVSSITSSNAGTYTVQATLNGCSASATTVLTMNPLISTAINAAGPFCSDDSPFVLTAVTGGGVWDGPGITNPATGLFNPSVANVGSNTVTYEIPGACSDVSSISIVVNPLPVVSFQADKTVGCLPLTVNFTNTSTSGGSLLWNFAGTTDSGAGSSASFTFNGEGCYNVSLTLTDLNGCVGQNEVVNMVCVSPVPMADFNVNQDEADIFDPVFQFTNTSVDATMYNWDFGDATASSLTNPQHSFPEEEGSYRVWLHVSNAAGCVDSTSKIVKVTEQVVFYVPNSFTPNGDEHNNTFQPVLTAGFDAYSYHLTIYDRWGETVFESKDASIGWDGTYNGILAQEGVYVWAVQFRAKDNDKKYKYNGSFSLLK